MKIGFEDIFLIGGEEEAGYLRSGNEIKVGNGLVTDSLRRNWTRVNNIGIDAKFLCQQSRAEEFKELTDILDGQGESSERTELSSLQRLLRTRKVLYLPHLWEQAHL